MHTNTSFGIIELNNDWKNAIIIFIYKWILFSDYAHNVLVNLEIQSQTCFSISLPYQCILKINVENLIRKVSVENPSKDMDNPSQSDINSSWIFAYLDIFRAVNSNVVRILIGATLRRKEPHHPSFHWRPSRSNRLDLSPSENFHRPVLQKP